MTTIDAVDAWEVLDSRGEPTVRVRIAAGDETGVFTVPAGASTGTHEAVERRDGGKRYDGRGVRGAVAAVRETLGPAVVGREVTAQRKIDTILRETDRTRDLSRLGANAVLGVSGAAARAASAVRDVPVYEHLAPGEPGRLPCPLVNVISGGLHGAGAMAIQDLMIVPVGASTYPAALELAWSVRRGVRDAVVARSQRPLVADEGGFAPDVDGVRDAFALLREGVDRAGVTPGGDIAYAVDVAATHFHDDGRYHLGGDRGTCDTDGMIAFVADLIAEEPIVAVEDPLAEDDWAGWQALHDRVGDAVHLIGDDLVVTDPDRLGRVIDTNAATAALLKPNQAGTITRTIDVATQARSAGLDHVVSARSGETADTTIADLAVACDSGLIKIGSLARSERLAKYNRLLEIDRTADRPFPSPPSLFPG